MARRICRTQSLFCVRRESLPVRLDFRIPFRVAPAEPGIEKVREDVFLPAKTGVCTRNNVKRLTPREDTLQPFAETADSAVVGSLGSEIDLPDRLVVLRSKRTI